MATTWTREIGIGNYGSRMRTTVSLVSQDRAANTSRIRVQVSIYNGGRSRAYDYTVSWSVSGTVSNSANGGISVNGGTWSEILNWQFTVPHNADGSKSLTINGTLGSTGTSTFGSGGTATVSGSLPRLLLAPSAPTGLTATRVSDTAQDLRWTNRPSARAPYDRLQLQRMPRSTQSFGWVATGLGGGTTSYRDSGTSGNNRYDYRVRAVNAAGASAWHRIGGTSDVSTTPAAPTGVTARKSGTSIIVSWTDQAANTMLDRTFLVEDSPDGGAWVQVGTIGDSATSWTHTAVDPSKTHRYRVRARIAENGNTLTSAYSAASDTVQLQAPPKAPALVTPRDGDTGTASTGSVEVSWTHNPVDTTAQEAYEVRYRIDGGTWQTITGATDSAADFVPVDLGLVGRVFVEWQVRTRGAHPDYGPWSPVSSFTRSSIPWVAVQAPTDGATVDTSRVAVSWEYDPVGSAPALAQAAWRVTLLDADGVTLEVASGNGAATTADLAYRLANQRTYTVRVEAANGDGVWSYAADGEVTISTDFPLPALVEAVPSWDRDEGTVTVAFEDSEEPRATYRWTGTPGASASEAVSPDGETVRVNHATYPVALGDEFADFAPGTGGEYEVSWLTGTEDGPAGGPSEYGRAVAVTPAPSGSGGWQTTASSRRYPVSGAAGQKVTLSAFVRYTGDADAMNYTLRVYAYDGSTQVGMVNATHTFPSGEWVRASVEITPDAAYTAVCWWLYFSGGDKAPAGSSVDITGVLVELGDDAPGDYFDGDTPGVTDVDAIDVERNDGDGWTLIASGIPTSTTVTDRTPRIGDVRYRAVSRTTLPTERVGPEAVAAWVHDHDPVYVSGGPGWSRTCTARGNEATDAPTIEQGVRQFAGRSLPVAFFGAARQYETTFTGRIHRHPIHPVSSRDDWVALLHEFGIVCFRDCTGRKVFGVLSTSFSTSGPVESVSLTVQQTDHTEGVPRVSDAELEHRLEVAP